MARCTWDPTSKEDNCKCHYCLDRKSGGKKPGPMTSWTEMLLLTFMIKQFFVSSDDGHKISSSVFKSLKMAALLTLACCAVATAHLTLEKNILCTAGSMNRDELFIAQRYCLMAATYTLGNFTFGEESLIHPGIGSSTVLGESPTHEVVRHVYYQWVPYFLLFQCIMLWVPEQGILIYNKDGVFKALVGNLDKIELSLPKTKKEKHTQMREDDSTRTVKDGLGQRKLRNGNQTPINHSVISYNYWNECKKRAKVFKNAMGNHGGFLGIFFVSEAIGSTVALANLFLTNIFLGNDFFSYGAEVLRHLWHKDIDPMDADSVMNQVFPKIAKCTWRRFGASGSIETKDLLCVLPLNVVYEKAYLVLWVAYIALAVVTSLCFIYHFCLLISQAMLERRILAYSSAFKLPEVDYRNHCRQVLRRCGRADKFMLYKLKRHTRDFSIYIKWLAVQLTGTDSYNADVQASAPASNETTL